MLTLALIGSLIGVLNSFILIIYAFTTSKGNKTTNKLFAFLILMLTLRISKSIVVSYANNLHDFIITLGLSGFLAIGPTFYLMSNSIIDSKFKLSWTKGLHLIPAALLLLFWFIIGDLKSSLSYWHLFYRFILLQYIIYLAITVIKINLRDFDRKDLIFQLNILSYFLISIWFLYLLNDVSGFPYLSGAILYSIIIYFSLFIVINKGFIINNSNPKYLNTGLKTEDKILIVKDLEKLIEEDKVFKSNLLSLGSLSKLLKTSTHALSQTINENYSKTYFEFISEKRINEAKFLLKNNSSSNISEIAYEVGYNSLSAFNTAFKKQTGLTPSKFRNE